MARHGIVFLFLVVLGCGSALLFSKFGIFTSGVFRPETTGPRPFGLHFFIVFVCNLLRQHGKTIGD